MGKKKSFIGREAFHRMNFLYQACHLVQAIQNKPSQNIAAYYGHIMTGVAKKSVLRIDPTIKRTLCKGCHNLLLPGQTSRVRITKKNGGQMRHLCLSCCTQKKFNLVKGYKIWSEREESIAEVIDCNEHDTPDTEQKINEQKYVSNQNNVT